MSYRISIDTGGTFTDVVVVDETGRMYVAKALTAVERAWDGIEPGLSLIAEELGIDVSALLAETTQLAYGTTRSTNAIVEGKTARTAFFTTLGFPDTLLLREGGKLGPFVRQEYPGPYVPRWLTFEIDERMDSDGGVFRELDEGSVVAAIDACRAQRVRAVGVSLLWSIVNPAHELRIAELLAERLPDVAVTLSHQLNPVVREYRRASSTVIDASLKPLMQQFIGRLQDDLHAAGLAGELLISTSYGGAWPSEQMSDRPIYSVGSGPSMAPVAGRHAGSDELATETPDVLVCDTGGTTFDVGLITGGEIHQTTETWLGGRWIGHITGTKAVDVRSIGAGGGSIVSIDSGGLLLVGPESAGADPGPACYGRGGTRPTVTDAAAILGFLDPDEFLGGRMRLDLDAARSAFAELARKLGRPVEEAARGAMVIATQNVVSAIREITIAQGIDPRGLAIVSGGGAGGLNLVQMARELGCRTAILPRAAGALSATGALRADVISEFAANAFVETNRFDHDAAGRALADVREQAEAFVSRLARLRAESVAYDASVDARYPGQVWELDTPLSNDAMRSEDDVRALEHTFHALHERVFAVSDPSSPIECVTWRMRATAALAQVGLAAPAVEDPTADAMTRRRVLFAGGEARDTPVYAGDRLPANAEISGPAIIVEPTATLVLDPGARARMSENGNYVIDTMAATETQAVSDLEEAVTR